MGKLRQRHKCIRCYLLIGLLLLGLNGGASNTVSADESEFTVLNERTIAQENAVDSKSKGSCKYAVVSGKVVVTRAEVSPAGIADMELTCSDVSDSNTELWLSMLESYGSLFSFLQRPQEQFNSNYTPIAHSAYRVAKAYACASLRSGFDLAGASLDMIKLAESYGRKSGDDTIVKMAQSLFEILDKSSLIETNEIPSCSRRGYFTAIPDAIWQQMQGRSWHANRRCPAREALAFARIPFIGFDGKSRVGEMIIAKSVAPKVLNVFSEIYASGFRIEAMDLIDKYDGDDAKSMAANNSSAFNCRAMTNSTQTSEHSTGRAIDLNPIQNPFVTSNMVEPASMYSKPSQRTRSVMGLIQKDSVVVHAFAKIGWKWGGSWQPLKDYQHFSETGH